MAGGNELRCASRLQRLSRTVGVLADGALGRSGHAGDLAGTSALIGWSPGGDRRVCSSLARATSSGGPCGTPAAGPGSVTLHRTTCAARTRPSCTPPAPGWRRWRRQWATPTRACSSASMRPCRRPSSPSGCASRWASGPGYAVRRGSARSVASTPGRDPARRALHLRRPRRHASRQGDRRRGALLQRRVPVLAVGALRLLQRGRFWRRPTSAHCSPSLALLQSPQVQTNPRIPQRRSATSVH